MRPGPTPPRPRCSPTAGPGGYRSCSAAPTSSGLAPTSRTAASPSTTSTPLAARGRGTARGPRLRPGNHNRRVRVIRYVTEGSFDSYMWQTLERKARFIAQILTGELSAREVEDVDTAALSYAEVKALAIGQPLLMEAATVAAEVARLRNLQSGHIRAQRRIRQDIDKPSATPIGARSAPGRWRPSPNTPSGATRCSPPTVADRWPTVAPSPRRWLLPLPRRCSRAPASTWASGAGSASRSPPPRRGVPARSRSPCGSPTGTPRRSSS